MRSPAGPGCGQRLAVHRRRIERRAPVGQIEGLATTFGLGRELTVRRDKSTDVGDGVVKPKASTDRLQREGLVEVA
jgi:hypothetical protein